MFFFSLPIHAQELGFRHFFILHLVLLNGDGTVAVVNA